MVRFSIREKFWNPQNISYKIESLFRQSHRFNTGLFRQAKTYIFAHNSLNNGPIFNPQKVLESSENFPQDRHDILRKL